MTKNKTKNKNNHSNKINKYTILALTCLSLLVNFWAWSVLSSMAKSYSDLFKLSSFNTALLVASPIILGAIGRILVGLLADKYGGKRLIVITSFLSAAVILFLVNVNTVSQLFMVALALGIAGTSFAAGSLFISNWFPKNERGLALGIYAFGNAGTAISGFVTPKLVDSFSLRIAYFILFTVLIITGILMAFFTEESSNWQPSTDGGVKRLKNAIKWKLTWRLALLYGLTFGGFVALSLYLPTLLIKSYGLSASDAAARAAGFALIATLLRPVGGWLSDKISGLLVLKIVFSAVGFLALFASLSPKLMPLGTIVFLSIGVMFGIGNGAVFAVIGHRCNEKLIGTVTGIVGAIGGVGGYIPTLIMGLSSQITNSYSIAFVLLAVTSFAVAISMRRLFGYSKTY